MAYLILAIFFTFLAAGLAIWNGLVANIGYILMSIVLLITFVANFVMQEKLAKDHVSFLFIILYTIIGSFLFLVTMVTLTVLDAGVFGAVICLIYSGWAFFAPIKKVDFGKQTMINLVMWAIMGIINVIYFAFLQ